MLEDLLLGPDLPGAACAGRWELFDPAEPGEDQDIVEYRHMAAIRLCRWSCPALDTCRAELHPFDRQDGARGLVLAGRVLGAVRPRQRTEPRVRALNLDDQAAEDMLVRLAAHVPAAVDIGRPFLAQAQDDGSVTLVTDDLAMWTVRTDGAVDRVIQLDHRFEITVYGNGRELHRWIGRPGE